MTETDRYLAMNCACSAIWIEDRMEPGPSCPVCHHYEPWPLVENCPRLGVEGPGQFDEPATELAKYLGSCGFKSSLQAAKSSGRTETRCFTYQHKHGSTSWTISVELSRYTDTDAVRSVGLCYLIGRKPALEMMFVSREQLLDILATIVQTISRHSDEPVHAAQVLFCNAPIVE